MIIVSLRMFKTKRHYFLAASRQSISCGALDKKNNKRNVKLSCHFCRKRYHSGVENKTGFTLGSIKF